MEIWVQNWFSKQEMELSKQEIELFLTSNQKTSFTQAQLGIQLDLNLVGLGLASWATTYTT